MNLTCFFDRTIKTISVIFIVTMMTLITVDRAVASDYCLGDWSQEAHELCGGYMMYVRSVVADRDAGRPKAEVVAEVHKAQATYVMPRQLALNYIEVIYARPDLGADSLVATWFGGCIDSYEEMLGIAKKELGIED